MGEYSSATFTVPLNDWRRAHGLIADETAHGLREDYESDDCGWTFDDAKGVATYTDHEMRGGGYDASIALAAAGIPHLHDWGGHWDWSPGGAAYVPGKDRVEFWGHDQSPVARIDEEGKPHPEDVANAVAYWRTRAAFWAYVEGFKA